MLLTPLLEPAGSGTRERRGSTQPVGAERTLANPQLRMVWFGLPRGSPDPMEIMPLSTDPPAAPRHLSRIAPGPSPSAPFGQRPARRLGSLPVRSAALRREESGSTGRQVVTKDAHSPSRPFTAWERPRGRRSAPNDWRPLREAIARGSLQLLGDLRFRKAPKNVPEGSPEGTEKSINPTLSRTGTRVKELGCRRNRKVK